MSQDFPRVWTVPDFETDGMVWRQAMGSDQAMAATSADAEARFKNCRRLKEVFMVLTGRRSWNSVVHHSDAVLRERFQGEDEMKA